LTIGGHRQREEPSRMVRSNRRDERVSDAQRRGEVSDQCLEELLAARRRGRSADDALKRILGSLPSRHLAAKLDLGHCRGREIGQHRDVLVRPLASLRVGDAERAEDLAARGRQGNAGIGDDAELGDRWIPAHHGIHARIGDNEGQLAGDDALIERVGERKLAGGDPRLGQTMATLEEHTVGVDQRHEGDRRAEGGGGEARESVEGCLGR
jgi:hypothetical protein